MEADAPKLTGARSAHGSEGAGANSATARNAPARPNTQCYYFNNVREGAAVAFFRTALEIKKPLNIDKS
jgi:hypothetical protein